MDALRSSLQSNDSRATKSKKGAQEVSDKPVLRQLAKGTVDRTPQ